MGRARYAIIGTGEVPCGIYPERSEFEIAYIVSRAAIRDAGLSPADIDAIICIPHIMGDEYNTEVMFGHLPEAIGAKNCKYTAIAGAGGGSTFAAILMAEGVIASGLANVVLLVHAQRFSQFSFNDQINYFARAGCSPEWEIPYGMTYNALAAMITKAYMDYTNTPIEHIAAYVVSCRKWASLQPNAMYYRKPVTLEEVLQSKIVAEPLTALMCNVLADGGAAMVLTSAERAKKLDCKPVYILAHSSDYSHRYITKAKFDLGRIHEFYQNCVKIAYDKAGIGPEDIDIFQVYAAYPSVGLAMMEALGFAKPGEVGQLVFRGETSPGGKFPCTTNGEAIGYGHTGTGVGFALYVETVRQLQNKAGEAQVPNARFAIVNCGGGAWMDIHYTILGNEDI